MDLLSLITAKLTELQIHSMILYYLTFISGLLINIVIIILLIKLIIWLIFGETIRNIKAKRKAKKNSDLKYWDYLSKK